ncbi:hypothetical protein L218DRAFT_991770, partial [Marasmius fiardii PR-910]
MATRTVDPASTSSVSQASSISRAGRASGIPRPKFGNPKYTRDRSPVYHTPANTSRAVKPTSENGSGLNSQPSEATAKNNNEYSPSPGHSLFSGRDVSLSFIEGWSESGSRKLPSIQTRLSQEIQSTVKSYFSELRRRYVLQTLRQYDLMKYSTTLIKEQDIKIDDVNGRVYHRDRPELVQSTRDIDDIELVKLRALYPEPFSSNDPSSGRRPPEYAPIVYNGPSPSRSGGGAGDNNQPPGNPNGGPGAPGDGPPDNSDNGSRGDSNNPRGRGNLPSGNPGGDHGDDGNPPSEPDNEGPSPNNSDSENDDRNNPFERARFTSIEPALTQKREWVYDPTPQSEEEMLKAAFKPLEDLIKTNLHCSSPKGNGNIQKTLIQSLPKP